MTAGISSPAVPAWDDTQQLIIDLPVNARVIVDAGPGTGKTAVACARVSHLIDRSGCPPQSVWLISFTRTAVKEIRDRIASHLNDPDAIFGVRIATVDAQAWSIHKGFKTDANLGGSFDANIEQALGLVETNPEVHAWLEEATHIVVDEAQDLVGQRAELVAALVRRLKPDAGVTVFTDPAQAIYGFAGDCERNGTPTASGNLDDLLTGFGGFSRISMAAIHRTKSASLLEIFGRTRGLVLAREGDPVDRHRLVRESINVCADRRHEAIFDPRLPLRDGAFVLFRRRSEALQASSFLHNNNIRHRLRMSGLPTTIPAWVGRTLGAFSDSVLTIEDFKIIWAAKIGATGEQARNAWDLLERIAPGRRQGAIDMRRLREGLGRSQPPLELSFPDFGQEGPIVGTIHAAKGRETDEVWLMMPAQREGAADDERDLDEETRVIFVGATRSRSTLTVGRGYRAGGASNLDGSGRVHEILWAPGKARVEIGRLGDLRASGVTGRSLFSSAEAQDVQDELAAIDGQVIEARADCDKAAGYSYRLRAKHNGAQLGVLSEAVNADLFRIASRIQEFKGGGRRRPPDYLLHLRVMGARTLVLKPDDPEIEILLEPWRSSGIMLVPLVLGFVTTFFPFRR